MSIERRQPGQRWKPRKARDENLIAAAAEDYARRKRLGEGGLETREPPAGETVYVKNSESTDRLKGEVLELSDLLPTDPEDDQPLFDGSLPAAEGLTPAILRAATPSDEIGEARVSGKTIARVNVTDASHDFATVQGGSFVLQSASSGPIRIIWKPSGTGEAECWVLLGGSGGGQFWKVWFHVDVALPSTRQAVCSVYAVPNGKTLAEVPKYAVEDGPAPENTLLVCDPLGCYFDEPDYVNREGYAVYMTPYIDTVCDSQTGSGSGTGTGRAREPIWMVDSLCCPQPECD